MTRHPSEALTLAEFVVENDELKARIQALQAWVERTDTWPSTAISAAMQVLLATNVQAALEPDQECAVERIAAGWEIQKQKAAAVLAGKAER